MWIEDTSGYNVSPYVTVFIFQEKLIYRLYLTELDYKVTPHFWDDKQEKFLPYIHITTICETFINF
jgi:hypothetical protein